MTNRTMFVVTAVVVAVGCGGNVVLDGASGGTQGSGTGGSGGVTSTSSNSTSSNSGGGVFATDAAASSSSSGMPSANCVCACETLTSAGGCGDVCNDELNGAPTTPNFCNSAAALPQCAACLSTECGFSSSQVGDPTLCPFGTASGSSSSSSSSSSGAVGCLAGCAASNPAAYQRFQGYELKECGCAGASAPCASSCTAACAGMPLGAPCRQCLLAQEDMATASACTVTAALNDCNQDATCAPFVSCALQCGP
jgi:hypothetical protein